MPQKIPDDLQNTLDRIASGKSAPHRNDGAIFQNREGLLPPQPYGYYSLTDIIVNTPIPRLELTAQEDKELS